MFKWMKSKTALERLQEDYQKKLHEAFMLSKVNRKAADLKTAEAEVIAQEIERLKSQIA